MHFGREIAEPENTTKYNVFLVTLYFSLHAVPHQFPRFCFNMPRECIVENNCGTIEPASLPFCLFYSDEPLWLWI